MSVPAAYLGVILIWATTPLAIKWSGEGPGFLFGVTGRMVIGAVLAVAAVRIAGIPLRRGRRALAAYAAAGFGIFGAMLCTYWASQWIPSGWIAVLFGLSPIITGILASFCFSGRGITPTRLAGALLGLFGLAIIFGRGATLSHSAAIGIGAVLLAALIHSASAVCIQRLDAKVPALAMVAGALAIAAPLFMVTWVVFDGTWPTELPQRAAGSIVYLAVVGSLLGFALFFFVLSHVEASRVALITLITPVAALLIGHAFNGEPLTGTVWVGAGLVVSGLAVFEYGNGRVRVLRSAASEP